MDRADNTSNQAEFQARPHSSVTAIVPADRLDSCVSAVGATGVNLAAMDVLTGADGAAILDRDGSRHGLRARLIRGLQMMGSSENELTNYSTALEGGQSVVSVPVADEKEADVVAAALERAGGERVLYFRSTAVERM